MGRIAEMIYPMMILLLAMNAIFLFIVYLPANDTQSFGSTIHRNYAGTNITQTASNLIGISADANNISGQSLGLTTATTTERTLAQPLVSVLFGAVAGCAIGAALGGIAGCVGGAVSLGLVGYFWQYFSALAFGYFVWIDLFINPAWGTGFLYLGLGLKAIFFVVMLIGLSSFILPMFSSWRK